MTSAVLRKRTRLLQFSWGLLTALLVYLLSGLFTNMPALSQFSRMAEIPASCLPVGLGNLRTELVTEVKEDNTKYGLFDAYLPGDAMPFSVLVSLKDEQCKLLYSNPMNEFYPYSRVFNQSVARQLTLGELRYSIDKAGGIDKFRSTLQPSLKDSSWQFSEEDIWAFKQVGIAVPTSVKGLR
ncbi:hypothetical protein NIES2119_17905 [[Phormidium ambiguum] IAM M-71]|uniref:Uncharacterized protein n=1 Tax=[Phormidium ambiguum] IAM M-71 TaxID=454136 RepID=A0A1U7IGG7_9CYAN|nr:hypothetical protein [Phormidium ambiguum]OKH36189.1 hypothetical protein NIES2119_17905 [Phormidium ambiguum IAM M-71]